MSLNAKYLACLAQYPLLTKSVTAGVLAAINELVATAISGDYHETKVRIFEKSRTIRHVLSAKTLLMIVYGALVATPISHQLYKILNRVFPGKLSPVMKIVQIITLLCTVSPTLNAVFVAWLSVINEYRMSSTDVKKELAKLMLVIKEGLKKNFWLIYGSSAPTSLFSIAFAQTFLPPELWVVFFNVVFFVLGTIQNTKFKLNLRKQRLLQEKKK